VFCEILFFQSGEREKNKSIQKIVHKYLLSGLGKELINSPNSKKLKTHGKNFLERTNP
jgi:hypothetical protein